MERSKVRDNVFGFFAGNFTESGYGIGQVNDFTAGVNGRKHSREYAAFCYYAGDDKMPGFFCGFYNLGDGKGGIDTFGEYRVCFYPWKEFRHHFIEPWIRVYSRINFIIFFPDTVRVFCSQILGKDDLLCFLTV